MENEVEAKMIGGFWCTHREQQRRGKKATRRKARGSLREVQPSTSSA
jgi:hypothetical protein